jgi:DNA-binding CsgD family transcriptional regulator
VPSTAPSREVHREQSPPPLADETIQLAQRLLDRAGDEAIPAAAQRDDAVMLDIEAHGVRCLLIAQGIEHERPPPLSPREQEIVRMVSQGYPNKTIAAVLDISTWTVATHLRRIFVKLGVRTRAAMVARAIELEMAPPTRRA